MMGKQIRYWGFAVIVNVAAAVVAVLAFGAWKRSEAPQGAVNVDYKREGFFELVEDVGYITRANTRVAGRAEAGGRTIYEVIYTTGPDHFRVVPEAMKDADACVLLFGTSFTFGDGV